MPLLGPGLACGGLPSATLVPLPTGSPESLPAKGPGTTPKTDWHCFSLATPDHRPEPLRGRGPVPLGRVHLRDPGSRRGRGRVPARRPCLFLRAHSALASHGLRSLSAHVK